MQWKEGEIEGVRVRPLAKRPDPRGWLAELFRSDETDPDLMPAMGYVSLTHPGVTRGPHEHAEQTDFFAFVGPGNLEVRLWDQRKGSHTRGNMLSLKAGEDNPVMLAVPPGVVHCYRNISDRDCLVLNFPNRLYAGKSHKEKVDEIRYEGREEDIYRLT